MEQVLPQALPAQAVLVVSSTWARDSHSLFDFEAHQLRKQTFTVQKSMVCVRKDNNVEMLSERTSLPRGSDELFRLEQKDGAFWVDKGVDKAASPQSSKKPWLVVRDMAPGGHRLSENDVIKLGRFKFHVRQLVASANGGAQPDLEHLDSGTVYCPNSSQDKLRSTMCRICLLEGPGEDDPLIAPCACKGSIEHIHLSCLRHWICGRLNLSDASDGSYFYRALPCELCKGIYPTYITVDGERTPLVDVPQTQPPFIVLENIPRDCREHATRGLHVISLAGKVVKIGRGHESDVRIADVSISRCHAMIRFHDGQFILEDNNSKFGTLVAMKKPRLLESGSTVSIQMGRTVLSLFVQTDSSATNVQPLPPIAGSNTHNERALQLSLLNRRSSRAEPADAAGGVGPSEETARDVACVLS